MLNNARTSGSRELRTWPGESCQVSDLQKFHSAWFMVREGDRASDATFLGRNQQEGVRTTKNNSRTPKLCQRPVGFTHLDSFSLGRFQRPDGQGGARAGFTKACTLTAPLGSFWKADWSSSAVWCDMIGGAWGKWRAELRDSLMKNLWWLRSNLRQKELFLSQRLWSAWL